MATPDTNIFVSDLPAGTDENTVKTIFGAYGSVVYAKIINSTNKPTCGAIVEYASIDEATWVVENVNGQTPDGCFNPVKITFKRSGPKKGKGGSKGGWGGGDAWSGDDGWGGGDSWGGAWGGGKGNAGQFGFNLPSANLALASAAFGDAPCDNLYMQNLPNDMTEETISQIFSAVGYKVVQAKVMPPKQPGANTCVATVRFASADDAKFVLENFNGAQLPGFAKPLQISYANKSGAASMYAQGSGPSAFAAALAAAISGGNSNAGSFNMPGAGGYGKAPVQKAMFGMQGAMQPYASNKPVGASDNLYIKGLPGNSDESFVKALFEQYGTVRTCKVLKKGEGEPCHALVRFSSVEEAQNIISTLNGGMLEGFTSALEITFAIEKSLANLGMGAVPAGGSTGSPEIDQMLDEWVKAKRMRDFTTADSIRGVLRAQGIDPDTVRPISTDAMLDEWVKAKRMRDFGTADSLRAALRAQGIDPDTARPPTLFKDS
eukprot:TRINITY_DN8567_c0_g1_i1.p1 TRINITY_DN8567_c0_g1~~TRINITY_DN8567_c0_g1_i1.p1  ORF type:complete len:490 (+),score=93.10 TRINITY_DN8567_c0_g1_i1:88-1557(+)